MLQEDKSISLFLPASYFIYSHSHGELVTACFISVNSHSHGQIVSTILQDDTVCTTNEITPLQEFGVEG